jgi:transcription initiation factor TFIID subunit 5
MVTPKMLKYPKIHTDWIRGGCLLHDDDYFVSCSNDQTAKVWRNTTGNCVASLEAEAGWVFAVTLHPKENYIVTTHIQHKAIIWVYKDDEFVQEDEIGFESAAHAAKFSNDGENLFISTYVSLRIIDFETRLVLTSLKTASDIIWALEVTKEGGIVIGASADKNIYVW